MARPSGSPHTMATDDPVTMTPTATPLCFSPTTRTASGEAMDQNTAWAAATMRRAPTSRENDGASAEATCPAAKRAMEASSTALRLNREASTMRGIDKSATAHAYSEMMSPASASVIEKLSAMSTRRPMGMNSDVFITNAENASPMRAIQCARGMVFFSFPENSGCDCSRPVQREGKAFEFGGRSIFALSGRSSRAAPTPPIPALFLPPAELWEGAA